MSKTDYIIGFSSTKFSHGILTTRAAVMFGSLIQQRKGKLNYISFLIKSSLYKLYLSQIQFMWESTHNYASS